MGFKNDNVHVVDPGGTDAQVTVSIPGCGAQARTVAHAGGEQIFTCAGGFGGPVMLTSSQPILASQRVQYYASFNEVWAQPAGAASSALDFTWFDRVSDPAFRSDNVHVVDPGPTDARVAVTIPGCGPQSLTVTHGGERVFTCASGFGGPVSVTSDQPVLASQRVQYAQSFNEVWAQPAAAAATSLDLTWFDRVSDPAFRDDNVHVVNPGPNDAQVTVSIPGCGPQVQGAGRGGGEALFTCAAGFGGPVTVRSDQPVLASQRVRYGQSFNEVWAERVPSATGTASATTVDLTWFDRVSDPGFRNDNVHVVDPGPDDALVTVSIPGCGDQSSTIAAGGGEQVFTCATGFGGPVRVASSRPVLVSQRVQYYSSFNEVWASR